MTSGAQPVTAWFGMSVLLAAACANGGTNGSSGGGPWAMNTGGSSGSNAASGSSGSGSGSSSGGVASSGGSGGSSSGVPSSSGVGKVDGGQGVSGQMGDGGQGGSSGGMAEAGAAKNEGGAATGGDGGPAGSGTCTASTPYTGVAATGTGPHKVTIETNSDMGISTGTIFRPTDLGGSEKYPIYAWGEGGCMQDSTGGSSQAGVLEEIASHGYFIIADGLPGGTGSGAGTGQVLLDYIGWAIAENGKPCSAYYQSLDTTKVATNGFSCGGLMAEQTAGDPRITTWALNSSGLFAADQTLYNSVHTPVLIVLGGSNDIAYQNGENDYTAIAMLGKPIMLFSKNGSNHGGDLFNPTGDFSKIDLAWLNWWLKNDLTATGKGVLVGSTCTYCTDTTNWEVKSMNIP
jgi:hypothetical protein